MIAAWGKNENGGVGKIEKRGKEKGENCIRLKRDMTPYRRAMNQFIQRLEFKSRARKMKRRAISLKASTYWTKWMTRKPHLAVYSLFANLGYIANSMFIRGTYLHNFCFPIVLFLVPFDVSFRKM